MTSDQNDANRIKEQVKEKLASAAEDLRRAAEQGHPHAGHLHEEAEVIEHVARQTEETLDKDSSPIGKSGEGISSRPKPGPR